MDTIVPQVYHRVNLSLCCSIVWHWCDHSPPPTHCQTVSWRAFCSLCDQETHSMPPTLPKVIGSLHGNSFRCFHYRCLLLRASISTNLVQSWYIYLNSLLLLISLTLLAFTSSLLAFWSNTLTLFCKCKDRNFVPERELEWIVKRMTTDYCLRDFFRNVDQIFMYWELDRSYSKVSAFKCLHTL